MRWSIGVVASLGVAGCSFAAKFNGRGIFPPPTGAPLPSAGVRPSGQSASAPSSTASGDGFIVPDLTGRTVEEAAAILRSRGFEIAQVQETDYVCGYQDDASMVRQGTVCAQEPVAGVDLGRRIFVRLTVERDTYDHGGVGLANEWHRMPDVVGKTLDDARSTCAHAGLPLETHFEIIERVVDGCAAGHVCATEPSAAARKVVARKGRIVVGRDVVENAAATSAAGDVPRPFF